MSEQQKETEKLELIPGKTEIGQIKGKLNGVYHEITLMYGDVAAQVIDGEFMHLGPEKYRELLNEFLDSVEGQQYRRPSDQEIEDATNKMLELEDKVIEKRKEDEKRRQEMEAQRLEDERKLREKMEAEKLKKEAAEREKAEREEEEKRQKEIESERKYFEELDSERTSRYNPTTEKEKVYVTKKKKINGKNVAIILLILFLLASLFANAYMYMNGGVNVGNKETTFSELNVDGTVYRVPAMDLSVQDGEKKVVIYGITASSENGEVSNKVIPIGEITINSSGEVVLQDGNGNSVQP